jgi:hypothetical protein
VEEDYILDRFNLTGLNVEVQHYTHALDLITDNLGAHPLKCDTITMTKCRHFKQRTTSLRRSIVVA